jgi:hypothetical protein
MPTRTPAPTSTPEPTVTEDMLPINYQIVEQCVDFEDRFPEDFVMDGKLVWYCDGGGCIMGFQDQQAVETPITPTEMKGPYSSPKISPDWKWMAYEVVSVDENLQAQNLQLRIVSADGQEMPVTGWKPDWQLIGWKDNETLNFETMREDDYYVIVFNPRTGEATETLLPPLHNRFLGSFVYPSGLPAYYDPTYTRVAYATEGSKFVLWNVPDEKLLWERIAGEEIIFGVHWSPDSQQVAVPGLVERGKAELFVVDRDGEEKQMTNLKSAYPGMNTDIGDFNWSPSGRYIALWLNVYPGEYWEQWRLAILDLQTGILTDTCISDGRRHDPLWSPNARQVAFEGFETDNPDVFDLVVLDIGSNMAIRLPHELGLIGWMKDADSP